jgi:alpha-glucoside transport system permease protein
MRLSLLALAAAAVIGVPLVLTGYIFLVERGIGRLGRKRQEKIRPWLWLLPAFFLLSVFLVYPVVNTMVLSLMNARSTAFIGLANYRYIFTDRAMLVVLRNNAWWLVFFTLVTITLGLLIAVLTDRVRYESAAKAIIFLPMAISFVAAGVIWKFMYEYRPRGSAQIGTVNALLSAASESFQPRAWLFNPPENNFAMIAVGIWMWTGFAMVVLSAGLKGIPGQLVEAARIDGATELQVFFRITLPLLAPTITVVATTLVINVLKIFDIVYVMTNGNLSTEVIANRMYKEMFNYRNYGRASALAVLLLVAIIPVMAINIRRFGERALKK